MTIIHAYAATVTKSERDDAGDLIVYGKATGPDLDLDAQVCDPAWLKSAMPAWMTWGNLREMHQPIAAGVGIELAAEGDDWMLKSKVVDDGTAKKIEAGALKGYSVGIKNAQVVKDAKAPGGRIVGGEIVEVSYVDRPCLPTATMSICKAAASGELSPVDAEGHLLDEAGPIVQPDADKAATADGAAGAGPVFDRNRAERLVKAVAADGTVDEQPDIEGAVQAIALIAGLIQAEAAELATGRYDETWDISLLLRAVEALKVFLARERAGANTDPGVVSAIDMAATADVTKTAGGVTLEGLAASVASLAELVKGALTEKRDVTADKGTVEQDITKTTETPVSKDELDKLVKNAVTEANKAAEGRIEALAAELAKVKATPIPGGPVITRTATTTPAPVEGADKAAYYRRLAGQVNDSSARAGYLKLAADAERGN